MDNRSFIRIAILTGLFVILAFVDLAESQSESEHVTHSGSNVTATKANLSTVRPLQLPRPTATRRPSFVGPRPNKVPKNDTNESTSEEPNTKPTGSRGKTRPTVRPMVRPFNLGNTTLSPNKTSHIVGTRPPVTNTLSRSASPNLPNKETGPPNTRPVHNMPGGWNTSISLGPRNSHRSSNRFSGLSGLLMEASVIGNLLENFQGLFNDLAEKGELFMKNLRRRYPPFKRMFEGAEKIRERLSSTKRRTLEKLLQDDETEATSGGYNLTDMSTDDVMRLLDDLDQISEPVRDKLVSYLPNCSNWELLKMPGNILPAFSETKFQELASLRQEQLSILCDKLLDDGSSPWNLVTAIRGGLRCQPMRDISGKRKCKTTISKVMMDIIRVETPPSGWNSSFLQTALQYIGAGVKAEDIMLVPVNVVQRNKKEMSKTELPFPSQREALVTKLTSGLATPTAWPDQLVKELGKLLENVDLYKLMLIRHKGIELAARNLTEAGIRDPVTRTVISKLLARSLTVSPQPGKMTEVFPWLKGDASLMQNLNATNFITALLDFGLSLDDISHSEAYHIARRLERFGNLKTLLETMNITAIEKLINPNLVPGFSAEILEALPDTIIEHLKNSSKPIRSVRKARMIARRIKRNLANESNTMSIRDVGFVMKGIRLADFKSMQLFSDIDNMVMDPSDNIHLVDIPDHFAYHSLKMLTGIKRQMAASVGMITCDDYLYRLGKLAKHLDVEFIKDTKLLPFANEDEKCSFDMSEVELARSQAYAIVDNIRENMGSVDVDGTRRLKPVLIKRLGKLSIGLAAEDIEKLPTDTELLTVIETLSDYEDELDSHQIRAIVQKIRDYFDLPNRQIVDELTEITATQIGRFLQYLNVEFELSKFPKQFRPEIMREIGKSSLTKISTPHRQNLLKFALENSRTSSGAIQDATKVSILHEHVIDLGRLLCGMTEEILHKMSTTAMNKHIKHMQNCPYKEGVAKALIKKALNKNINRLKAREHLVSMAGLLQYLDDYELNQIAKEELVPVTEYILEASKSRDEAWEATENNGFIRERTTNDKQKHQEQKIKMLQLLYDANSQIYGADDKCKILLKFGDHAADFGAIDHPCADELAALPMWTKQDARKAIQNIVIRPNKGMLLNEVTVSSHFDEDIIEELSGLMKGLTIAEFAKLNITEETVYAVGSVEGLTPQQLRTGANKVFPGSKETLKSEDLINLCNFACGVNPEEIRSIKDRTAVRGAIRSLGRRRGCDEEQLKAYAEKLSEGLGTNVKNWNTSDIHAMGHILGGLTQQQIRQLSRRQLQAIEPAIISKMPSQKVSNFTTDQLKEFSPLQSNAVTSMQRSYMSEPQVAALQGTANSLGGYVYDNGFQLMTLSYTTLTCCSMVVFLIYTDFEFLRRYRLP